MLATTYARAQFTKAYLQANDLTWKLYSNDITPNLTHTAADFTEVTSDGGYRSHIAHGANWTFTEGTTAIAEYPKESFIFTGASGNIYGWYLVDGDGNLIFAHRFAQTYNIVNADDTIKAGMKVNLVQTA